MRFTNWLWLLTVTAVMIACGDLEAPALDREAGKAMPMEISRACDTTQIFGNGQHTGQRCSPLGGMNVMATLTQDPDAAQENADLGFLGVHYGSVLTRGSWFYVPDKHGYTDLEAKDTQTWGVTAYRWIGDAPVTQWHVDSKWKPLDAINPFGGTTNGYESLFQPAIANGVLYMPSAAGRVVKLDLDTGAVVGEINPLAGTAFDANLDTIVSSAISHSDGTIAYTVIAWDPSGSRNVAPRASWLVTVTSSDAIVMAAWGSMATAALGVVQPLDPCTYNFGQADPPVALPWPGPLPTSTGPVRLCTPQRPTVNAAPAFTHDGNIVVTSTANNATPYSYLLVVNAKTLAPVKALSLRDKILDACGQNVAMNGPDNADPFACRFGTPQGYDPQFGQPVAGRNNGIMESAPVVTPDGKILVASYSGPYDRNQGHLHLFETNGEADKPFFYGWSSTPSVFVKADGSYEFVSDLNRFAADTGDGTGSDPNRFYAHVRLNENLLILHSKITGVPEDATAFAHDYLNGQLAVDSAGNAYALDASGRVVKFGATGDPLSITKIADSAETLSAEPSFGVDGANRPVLYVPFAGTIYAVGGGPASPHPVSATRSLPRIGTHHRGASSLIKEPAPAWVFTSITGFMPAFSPSPQTVCAAGCQTNYDCWDQCGGASNTICVGNKPGIGSCRTLTAPPIAPADPAGTIFDSVAN